MPKELSKEEKLVVLEFVGEGIVVAEKLSISDMFSVRAVPGEWRSADFIYIVYLKKSRFRTSNSRRATISYFGLTGIWLKREVEFWHLWKVIFAQFVFYKSKDF